MKYQACHSAKEYDSWLCCMCQHLPRHLNRGLPQLYNVLNEWLLNELTLDELWHMDLQSILVRWVKKCCLDRFLSAVLLTGGRLATTVCHKALIRSTPNDICSQTLLCRYICKWLVRCSLDLSCIIDRVWGLVYEGYCKYLNLSAIDWQCLGSRIREWQCVGLNIKCCNWNMKIFDTKLLQNMKWRPRW